MQPIHHAVTLPRMPFDAHSVFGLVRHRPSGLPSYAVHHIGLFEPRHPTPPTLNAVHHRRQNGELGVAKSSVHQHRRFDAEIDERLFLACGVTGIPSGSYRTRVQSRSAIVRKTETETELRWSDCSGRRRGSESDQRKRLGCGFFEEKLKA